MEKEVVVKLKNFIRYKKNKTLILAGKKKLPGKTIRKILRPLFRSCLWAQRKINGFSVEVLSEIKPPEGRPVIFALTHIGKWDFEIVNEQIRAQSFVIASDFVDMYGNLSSFFMNLNGVVYVDEEDREDRANTKKLMVKLLQSGRNVMIFPEGTWNFFENEIIRDIAYGTAEAAVSAGVVILPIAVEQYDKHFVICPGEIIDPVKVQKDKRELTIILRDELASLKWKIWERKGICQRSTLPPDHWEQFIRMRRMEWKGYSMREQVVNTYIPKEKWEYWQLQRDLKTDKMPLWYRILLEEETSKESAIRG